MSFNYPSQRTSFDADSSYERRHNSNESSSLSSSRWIPPTTVQHPPPPHSFPAAAPASKTISGNDARTHHKDSENNYRLSEGERGGDGGGGGRQGGGKIVRQKRHGSNDTHRQRNLHRRPPPHHKNIISPTDTASSSFSSQPFFTIPSCSTTTTTTASTNTAITNMKQNKNTINDDTPKLNPSIPAEARRINQRLRQVLFGKNTVGYEEYIKKVPKDKRKHRSLECPMTPDHRADIPTKRWQGLLNAWRRALHQYDPADLHLRQQSSSSTSITLAPRPCSTKEDVQAEEIAQAKASGLQVAFGSMNVGEEARLLSMKVAPDSNDEEDIMLMKNSAMAEDNVNENERNVGEKSYFDEEVAYQKAMMMGDTDFLQECESESDDDIL